MLMLKPQHSESPICRKMPEGAFYRCEKTTRTRARRWFCFLMLLLTVGTFLLTFHTSSFNVSRHLTTQHSGHITINTSVLDISDDPSDDPSVYLVAYPKQYRIIIDEPHRCGQESPFLVLMIPVAPNNRNARDTIRNTWGKETTVLGRVVSHYFLLGIVQEEVATEHMKEQECGSDQTWSEYLAHSLQVLKESQTHHDILQSDFVDSYNNLTIKTMVMFEWLSSHCPNTSYAMKIDTDIFLNIRNLIDMLVKAPRHLFLSGLVVRDAVVHRDRTSKWFLPVSVFPESYYPPYAQGLGYVFSLDIPNRILEAAGHVKAVYIEDVYVGMCMNYLGIALVEPPRGDLFQRTVPDETNNCYWSLVIATILTNSDQLSRVWSIYQAQDSC